MDLSPGLLDFKSHALHHLPVFRIWNLVLLFPTYGASYTLLTSQKLLPEALQFQAASCFLHCQNGGSNIHLAGYFLRNWIGKHLAGCLRQSGLKLVPACLTHAPRLCSVSNWTQVRADGAGPSDATGICSLSRRHVHLECMTIDFLIIGTVLSNNRWIANYKYLEPYDNGNVPATGHWSVLCILWGGADFVENRRGFLGSWQLLEFGELRLLMGGVSPLASS